MARFNVSDTDSGLSNLLSQFEEAMLEYGLTIGFSPPEIAEVTAATTQFNEKLLQSNMAKAAARAAIAEKDDQRRESVDVLRRYAQRVKVNPLADKAIKEAFGIKVNKPAYRGVVNPSALSAKADANGTCLLNWRSNGNPPGTSYIVEILMPGGEWSYLTTVTATRYLDPTAIPGMMRSYRVFAKRGGQTSPPTFAATIYARVKTMGETVAA